MTDHLDQRLSDLLAMPLPEPDPLFVDRVVLAARIDRQLAAARRRSLRRAMIECGSAAAVGASFYFMSQMGEAGADGLILPGGPAMAGLVMLLLWAAVALPISAEPRLSLAA